MPAMSMQMPMMGTMPGMMSHMNCEMTDKGMMCMMMPGEGMTMDMMKDCCMMMQAMMKQGMPVMMTCNGMPMMTMCGVPMMPMMTMEMTARGMKVMMMPMAGMPMEMMAMCCTMMKQMMMCGTPMMMMAGDMPMMMCVA
jgi:hypothetical protein